MNRAYNLMQRITLYLVDTRISRNTVYLDNLIAQRKPDMLLQSLFTNVIEAGRVIFKLDKLKEHKNQLEDLLGVI